ncbi:hypothetical protein IFM89_028288 [Coptis chinensis]|uniref:Uncharacterized protein n=1 Tax=Coptis chinensis TaxID=261450 RepID=A0A835HFV8_9MAGN|nr:hypothetical protein IFM89_028288 [Coptis chinensis]
MDPHVPEDVKEKTVLAVNKSNKKRKTASLVGVVDVDTPNSNILPVDLSSLHQTTLPAICDKKDKDQVDRALAHSFFDKNIAFNVIQSQSFLDFYKALSDYGSGYKVPSYLTLRTKELPEYEERNEEQNVALGNSTGATTPASAPTPDDIIFDNLFGHIHQ